MKKVKTAVDSIPVKRKNLSIDQAGAAILNLRFDKEFTVIGTSYGLNVFDELLPCLSQ